MGRAGESNCQITRHFLVEIGQAHRHEVAGYFKIFTGCIGMLWFGKHGFTALIGRSIFRVDLKGAIKISKGAGILAKLF
jgi:hypothetical protein